MNIVLLVIALGMSCVEGQFDGVLRLIIEAEGGGIAGYPFDNVSFYSYFQVLNQSTTLTAEEESSGLKVTSFLNMSEASLYSCLFECNIWVFGPTICTRLTVHEAAQNSKQRIPFFDIFNLTNISTLCIDTVWTGTIAYTYWSKYIEDVFKINTCTTACEMWKYTTNRASTTTMSRNSTNKQLSTQMRFNTTNQPLTTEIKFNTTIQVLSTHMRLNSTIQLLASDDTIKYIVIGVSVLAVTIISTTVIIFTIKYVKQRNWTQQERSKVSQENTTHTTLSEPIMYDRIGDIESLPKPNVTLGLDNYMNLTELHSTGESVSDEHIYQTVCTLPSDTQNLNSNLNVSSS